MQEHHIAIRRRTIERERRGEVVHARVVLDRADVQVRREEREQAQRHGPDHDREQHDDGDEARIAHQVAGGAVAVTSTSSSPRSRSAIASRMKASTSA